MNTGLLLVQQRQATEERLAKKFDELVRVTASSSMPGSVGVVQALKVAQPEWLKYRDAECGLVGALTGAGGTWPSTYAVRCEANLTEQRLSRVQSAIRCINRAAAKDQEFQASNCLQQLAPVANRL